MRNLFLTTSKMKPTCLIHVKLQHHLTFRMTKRVPVQVQYQKIVEKVFLERTGYMTDHDTNSNVETSLELFGPKLISPAVQSMMCVTTRSLIAMTITDVKNPFLNKSFLMHPGILYGKDTYPFLETPNNYPENIRYSCSCANQSIYWHFQ